MFASQIQNLPPTPVPVPVPEVPKKKPRRRGGIGDLPESNLFDAIERDEIEAAATEQAEVRDLASEAADLADALLQDLTIEVSPLDTHVVVDSVLSAVEVRSPRTEATVETGELDARASAESAPSLGVDVLGADVTVDVPDND
jgi:hypothetical protein